MSNKPPLGGTRKRALPTAGVPAGRPGRTRLGVEERRRRLLALGLELFSTRPFEDVCVEGIAARAGVSRGLLYHYFPTKRDFFIAVTREAAAEVAALTEPDPALPPVERIHVALDEFLAYAECHVHGFLATYRGQLSADVEVRRVVGAARSRQSRRILDAVAPGRERPALLQLAVRGWLALAQEVVATWLESGHPSRADVHALLLRSLLGAVQAAPTA